MSLSNMEEQAGGDTAAEKQQKEAVSVELQSTEENVQKNDTDKKPADENKEKPAEESKKKQKAEAKEAKKAEAAESKPDESEDNEEMETDKKDEGESPKQGLLDKPLVIEGKRERHSVVRLSSAPTPPVKKQSVEVSGSGAALGDIEYVNAAMGKLYSESLKTLHRLCYGTTGTATTRKKELRRFNGFPYDVDSPEFEKKKALAMKLNSSEIREIRRILGSEAGQTKADTVTNMLKFLQKPRDLGLKVPGSKKRKSSVKSKKPAKKAKKETPKKGQKSEAVGKDSESESESDENESEESEKDEDKIPEKTIQGKKQEKSPLEKATPKKAAGKNKRPTGIKLKKPAEKTSTSAAVTSTPTKAEISQWGSGGPSDEELNAAINELLHSVDLVHCTMKQMCQRISEKFPNLDMATHKSALKDRVKEALEQMEE